MNRCVKDDAELSDIGSNVFLLFIQSTDDYDSSCFKERRRARYIIYINIKYAESVLKSKADLQRKRERGILD